MPSPLRPRRQPDYSRFSPSTPIVIDNGASSFRIGWAGEMEPRFSFRNASQRPRHKATGETVTIVGEIEPSLVKYFDWSRSSYKSPFDNNVVFQFEVMEYVLDYGFERLGAEGSQVDHPILITECACNPITSRSKMAEILFETYGIPSLAFGVDAAFSYKYNEQLGICNEDGLAVCSGLSTSHIIPFIKGEPALDACCRTDIGGYHVTDYLQRLLSLKYPHHIANITWEKAEDLKKENCYVALDYASELQLFKKGTKEAEEKTRCWQLPWVPPLQEAVLTEEEVARKTALREKQGQRFREMAAAKRSLKISALEKELHDLEYLLQKLDESDEAEIFSVLSRTTYNSRQEIESAVVKVGQSLRKAKGEPSENEDNTPLAERYPLADIPDEMLAPEQIKEKKRQAFLKMTSEGKMRAKQKRLEDEMLKERQNQRDEEKRLENPELYLEELKAKYEQLSEKVEQRKRLKTNGNQNASAGIGRGERVNTAQKEKMRIMTTAAFDRGKGEDTFGSRDEDWQLYNLMSRDNDDDDDEGHDEDEAELARVTSRLQDSDPTFVAKPELVVQGNPVLPGFRPVTEEDFQVILGVERFRCPEILFQPSMVGVNQAGLDEMVGISLRKLSSLDETIKNRMCTSVLLTGGSSLFPGLDARLESGIRMVRPYLSPLKVVRASDPILDAWRGATTYAVAPLFSAQTFTSHDYFEGGEGRLDALQQYNIKYSI